MIEETESPELESPEVEEQPVPTYGNCSVCGVPIRPEREMCVQCERASGGA